MTLQWPSGVVFIVRIVLCLSLVLPTLPGPALAAPPPDPPPAATSPRIAPTDTVSWPTATDDHTDLGTILGQVVHASTGEGLPDVPVSATGDIAPIATIYLPLILKQYSVANVASSGTNPEVRPQVMATYDTTTDAGGYFTLTVPAGTYTVTVSSDTGYTGDRRPNVTVRAHDATLVSTVRILPLDSQVTDIGPGGGVAASTTGLSSTIEIAAGVLTATTPVRVTYVSPSELPGPFDGYIPQAFSDFKPNGLVFPSGGVTWTVEYTGSLPVGTTDVPCFWWDGEKWTDPTMGKVVSCNFPSGKCMQANIHHFTAYGYSWPPPSTDKGPVAGDPSTTSPPGRGGNRDQDPPPGELINLGTGSVADEVMLLPVAARGFPVVPVLRYDTYNDTPAISITVPFMLDTDSNVPVIQEWEIQIAGRRYSGSGYTAQALWDTRDGRGYRAAPGRHEYRARETFVHSSGSTWVTPITSTVEVRRGDLSPFGYNWMTPYDVVLVDRTDQVAIVTGEGQMFTFTRNADGSYSPPPGEFSTLVKSKTWIGTDKWVWTQKYGTVLTFNSLGRPIRIEDPNGNTVTLSYESNGRSYPPGVWGLTTRLKTITDPSGGTWTFAYGADNLVDILTDPVGRTYTFQHDASGNLTRITDPLGRSINYTYDTNHRMTSRTDPKGNTKSFAYDAQGRLVKRTDPLGGTYTATYDANGSTWTDERGNAVRYTTNDLGAVIATSSMVKLTTYSWTDDRQLKTIHSDPFHVAYEYDQDGNMVHALRHDDTNATYEATFNRPVNAVNSVGNSIRFGYDAHANVTSITDPSNNALQMAYDSHGQITRITDPLGNSSWYSHDGQGNLIAITDALSQTWTYGYDSRGNLTSMTDPKGRSASFGYDIADRQTVITDALGGRMTFTYDANDNLIAFSDANGVTTRYAYDALDRLTVITYPHGSTTTYGYDAASNLVSRTDGRGNTVNYTYDAANRLTQISYPDGSSVTYAYDQADNAIAAANQWEQTTYELSAGFPDNPSQVVVSGTSGVPFKTTITYDYVIPASGMAAASPPVALSAVEVPSPNSEQSARAEAAATPDAPARPGLDLDRARALLRGTGPAATAGGGSQPAGQAVAAPATRRQGRMAASPATRSAAALRLGPVRAPRLAAGAEPAATSPSSAVRPPTEPGVIRPYHELPTPLGTNVSGDISGDTTWTLAGSPYVLTNDVRVLGGATLTVEPGVTVQGQDDVGLEVQGHLRAVGTASQPITFTSQTDTGGGQWDGLSFDSGGTGELDHATVRYGGDPYYPSSFPFTYTNANVHVYGASSVTIRNSTIRDSLAVTTTNYGVYVNDNSSVVIANSIITGNDECGVYVDSSTAVITDSTIAGHDDYGVYVYDSTLAITNSTVVGNGDYGLYTTGWNTAISGSGNTFRDNSGYPVRARANIIGSLMGNTYSGNGQDRVLLAEGDFDANATLGKESGLESYELATDISVYGGVTLTVEPGVIIRGRNNAGLEVRGHLRAVGTASQPITFTSVTDTGGGQWDGLVFNHGTGELEHATVRYGGNTYYVAPFYSYANVHVHDHSNVTIRNSTIRDSLSSATDYGVYVRNSTLVITNSTIAGNDDYGLYAIGDVTLITATGNIFSDNGSYAVWLPADAFGSLADNTYSGNGQDRVLLSGGNFKTDATLGKENGLESYELAAETTVNSGATLTVEPGVTIRGRDDVGLDVQGRLQAVGTASQPILFTSVTDTAGGQWGGLIFYNSTSELDYTTVRYGGDDHNGIHANVQVHYGSNVTIRNSTIRDSFSTATDYGVHVDGSTLVITNSTISGNDDYGVYNTGIASSVNIANSNITGNGQYGVYNNTSSVTVMAENNWWGSSSGPYHPTLNPGGQGDRVSDYVDFTPWRSRRSGKSGLRYGLHVQTNNAAPLIVRYSYNTVNGVSTIASQSPAVYTYTFSYDSATRLTATGPAPGSPGVGETLGYDAVGRVVYITHTKPAGQVLSTLQYTRDAVGNVVSVTANYGTTSYEYDALNRLTRVTFPDSTTESYTYDAGGNRLSKVHSASGTVTYTYNSANQLIASTANGGTTYTYDANGNLLTKTDASGTTTYTWDYENRLIRIEYPDNTYSTYTYDHRGRRLSKTDRAGNTIYFVYDGANLVQEVDAAGNVVAHYVYGPGLDHPLSMTRNGTTYYYLTDQLGSVIGLTDGSGTLVATYTYDPWGNVISQTGTITNPFRFAGREYDEESGLYYLRARYYDPMVGRFISPDPLRPLGNGADYLYAANNPTNYVDPLGLGFWSRLGKVVGGVATVVGGIVELVVGGGMIAAPTGITQVGGMFMIGKGVLDVLGGLGQIATGLFIEEDADLPTGALDMLAITGSRLAGVSRKTERLIRGAFSAVDMAFGGFGVGGKLLPVAKNIRMMGYSRKAGVIWDTVNTYNTAVTAVNSTGQSATTIVETIRPSP